MVVGKAVRMAELMNIPVIGLVENMSYISCPHCGEKVELFGQSHAQEVAEKWGLKDLGHLPIDPALAQACDTGTFEDEMPDGLLDTAIECLLALPEKSDEASDEKPSSEQASE